MADPNGSDTGIANETVKMLAGMNLGFYIEAGCLTEKGELGDPAEACDLCSWKEERG